MKDVETRINKGIERRVKAVETRINKGIEIRVKDVETRLIASLHPSRGSS